jgi:hypothetical protein
MNDDTPLDDLLHAPPAAPSNALRHELLHRTTRVVRRRRLVRRQADVSALAAAVVVAALVGGSLRPPPPAPIAPPPPIAQQAPPAQMPEPKSPEPEPMPAALVKEWQAFDTRGPVRLALLLEAGDRYIADHHDLASAVRCYRQALDAAPENMLEIRPTDNWLVMALKLDRQKEN